jgi:multisubunit Na+/H+ antiporter MnhE subunit
MTVALMILWALAFWILFDGDPAFAVAGAIFGYVIGSS